MSIDRKEACPPQISTVLEIWQATLVEARITNADAVSAGCMLLGFICMNAQDSREDALTTFSDSIYDIYRFIDENWDQVEEMRAIKRRKRGD